MSGSIIIRLQKLPWTANSVDIRKFFAGLSIPDGGVHIVGGDQGDAFIAFASDEDARQAMAKDGGKIRETNIKLLLSSRNEMQKVIDAARSALADQGKPRPAVGQPNQTQQSLQHGINQMRSLNQGNSSQNSQPQLNRERSRSPLGRQQSTNGVNNAQNQIINPSPMSGLRPIMAGMVSQIQPALPSQGLNMNVMTRLGGFADNVRPNMTVHIANPQANQGASFGSGDSQSGPGWSRRLPDFNQSLNPNNIQNNNNNNIGSPLDLNGSRRLPGQSAPILSNSVQPFSGRVELRGLPFQVTPRDIQDFFRMNSGIFVPEDFIRILVDDNFQTTGGATVRFSDEAELQTALTLNGKFMAGRRIDVMPLPDVVPQQPLMSLPNMANNAVIPGLLQNQQQQQPQLNQQPQRDYVIYMKGIPFNACTEADVRTFFQNLRVHEIVFEMDPSSGKPAGNAFVELPTKEDYEGALAMNRRYMGRRYIEVFPTTRDDMEEARKVAAGAEAEKATFCVNITNLPPQITNNDLTSYFKEAGAVPFAIHIMLKGNGENAGEAFVEFATLDQQQTAVRMDGQFIGNFRIVVKEVPFSVMRKIVGRPLNVPTQGGGHGSSRGSGFQGRGGGFSGRFQGRGGRGSGRISPNRRRDPFADSRCVVHASNVPYKATIEDLSLFFADFAVLQNGIERRLNDKGVPTPEARVAFRTSLEAERAVKIMHKKHVLGRQIFLRLAV